MHRIILLAAAVFCVVGAGDAMAGCTAPSLQLQTSATTGFATALVTFVANNGANQTVIVDGRTLTRLSGASGASGANADATQVATAFRTGVAPGGQSFSGAYATWQVHSVQTGLTATQVRYVSTVPGTVANIPVTAGNNDPSQVTTQGPVVPALTVLLTNNTVCVGSASAWENQEWHQSGGSLWDWKLGNGHSSPAGVVDPTKMMGTWSIGGSGTGTMVSYTYTAFSPASGPHPFTVWRNSDADGPGLHTYSFCQGAIQKALARIYAGEVSCSSGGSRQ